MKSNTYIIILILSFCLTNIRTSAQTDPIITKLSDTTVCPGELIIPVETEFFNNVGSISLKLNYDSLFLVYDTILNINPALPSGFLMANAFAGQIVIASFSIQPIMIGTGKLFDLKFNYKGGNTSLNWDTTSTNGCTYTDTDVQTLNAKFISCQITCKLESPIPISPQNYSQYLNTDIQFSWQEASCNPLYEIQLSTDSLFNNGNINYSGILSTNHSFTGLLAGTWYYWHVRAFDFQYITNWSESFRFKTKGPDGVEDDDNGPLNYVKIYPNPVSSFVQIEVRCPSKNNLHFELYDELGNKQIETESIQITTEIQKFLLDISKQKKGIYFLRTVLTNKANSYMITKKIDFQ